jgi:O-antigen/teichoic acid export membrane protein
MTSHRSPTGVVRRHADEVRGAAHRAEEEQDALAARLAAARERCARLERRIAALQTAGMPPRASADDAAGSASVSIWRRVRRDIVLLGAGSVGIVVAQLVFRSILVTTLSPNAYGHLSLILSLYNTVLIVGASGIPNGASRYIAAVAPGDDRPIVSSSIRATAWPTLVAAAITAVVSGVLLKTPMAALLAAAGLSSLVYSVLATGILRGRGRVVAAASILPVAAVSEVTLLLGLRVSWLPFTPNSAFAVFCVGNCIGLVAGIVCVVRTNPPRTPEVRLPRGTEPGSVPSPRQLLGFSVWLAVATAAVALLPLIMRIVAVIDSYTVVALIDVSLVLLNIPQRMGAVIVQAVVPHATRALGTDHANVTISRREHAFLIIPFVVGAAVVAFTPLLGSLFDLLGKSGYGKSADYLALALLAGPARILYGLVQGILIAHGDGRFLARNAWSVTIVASMAMLVATLLGSTITAFGAFVVASWVIYFVGLARIGHINDLSTEFSPYRSWFRQAAQLGRSLRPE